jgi:hypothetical protein
MAPKGRKATEEAEILVAESALLVSAGGTFLPEIRRRDMGVKSIRGCRLADDTLVQAWTSLVGQWLAEALNYFTRMRMNRNTYLQS